MYLGFSESLDFGAIQLRHHSPVFLTCDHIYLLKHQKFHKIVNSLNNELSECVIFIIF